MWTRPITAVIALAILPSTLGGTLRDVSYQNDAIIATETRKLQLKYCFKIIGFAIIPIEHNRMFDA